jgi:hypothetical protein
LVAGLLPAIYEALKLDVHIEKLAQSAAEFTNLRDRFRQAEKLGPLKSLKDFETDFNRIMQRMEEARRASITPPERYFKKAQKKINAGDYSYATDVKKALELSTPDQSAKPPTAAS